MREAWRPLLFCDEDQEAKKTRDPVAPAKRSEAALRKIRSKKLDDGTEAHSFQTLLKALSTIVRNICRAPGDNPDAPTFQVVTTPDPKSSATRLRPSRNYHPVARTGHSILSYLLESVQVFVFSAGELQANGKIPVAVSRKAVARAVERRRARARSRLPPRGPREPAFASACGSKIIRARCVRRRDARGGATRHGLSGALTAAWISLSDKCSRASRHPRRFVGCARAPRGHSASRARTMRWRPRYPLARSDAPDRAV